MHDCLKLNRLLHACKTVLCMSAAEQDFFRFKVGAGQVIPAFEEAILGMKVRLGFPSLLLRWLYVISAFHLPALAYPHRLETLARQTRPSTEVLHGCLILAAWGYPTTGRPSGERHAPVTCSSTVQPCVASARCKSDAWRGLLCARRNWATRTTTSTPSALGRVISRDSERCCSSSRTRVRSSCMRQRRRILAVPAVWSLPRTMRAARLRVYRPLSWRAGMIDKTLLFDIELISIN